MGEVLETVRIDIVLQRISNGWTVEHTFEGRTFTEFVCDDSVAKATLCDIVEGIVDIRRQRELLKRAAQQEGA